MDDTIANQLEQRLGSLQAKQRLGIEKDHGRRYSVRESISSSTHVGQRLRRIGDHFRGLSAWRVSTSGGSFTGQRIVFAGTRFTTGCCRRPMKPKIARGPFDFQLLLPPWHPGEVVQNLRQMLE